MSSVIRQLLGMPQRESISAQSEVARTRRAVDRGSLPTAAPIRPLPIPQPLQNINVAVYFRGRPVIPRLPR